MTRRRTKSINSALAEDEVQCSSQLLHEYEYGGVFGTFMIYLVSPVLYLVMLLICTKADWSISKVCSNILISNSIFFFWYAHKFIRYRKLVAFCFTGDFLIAFNSLHGGLCVKVNSVLNKDLFLMSIQEENTDFDLT